MSEDFLDIVKYPKTYEKAFFVIFSNIPYVTSMSYEGYTHLHNY